MTLQGDADHFAEGDALTLTFTFENRTDAAVTDSTFSTYPWVDFYAGASECAINGSPIRLRTGTEIAPLDVLTCSFSYQATADDVAAGEINAWVALTVPYVGDTTSNVVIIPAG